MVFYLDCPNRRTIRKIATINMFIISSFHTIESFNGIIEYTIYVYIVNMEINLTDLTLRQNNKSNHAKLEG